MLQSRLLAMGLPLVALLVESHATQSTLPAQAPGPVIHGVLHYKTRGLTALPAGIFSGAMVGAGSMVMMQRIMRNFFRVFSAAPGLSNNPSMKEMNDFMRAGDNLDLSRLPIVSGYDADVSFILQPDEQGVFRLKTGSVTWSADNNSKFEVAGANGNTHRFTDQFRGQGSAPLNPETSHISLTFDTKSKPNTFDFEVDLSHPFPYDGKSEWSAMGGLVVISAEERAGTITWNLKMPFPGAGVPDRHEGEPGSKSVGYSRHGPVDSVRHGRELWYNAMDASELIEYELFTSCDAFIEAPAEDAVLVFDAASPARLEKEARAKVTPAFWGGDLGWKLPSVPESRIEPAGDKRTGGELPFAYEGMPAKNKDFGKRNIEAAFGSGGKRSVACKDPKPQPVRFFFSREAENNPGTPRAPNWFQYWKQTPAAQEHESGLRYQANADKCTSSQTKADGSTGKSHDFGYYPWNSFAEYIYICDFAPSGFRTQLLFGGAQVDGIDVFGVTVAHEWQHKTDFEKWWTKGYKTDSDKDLIPDAEEAAVPAPSFLTGVKDSPQSFNPQKWDTFGYGFGDEHYLAYAAELNWRVGSADAQDWSCPGHQAGTDCK